MLHLGKAGSPIDSGGDTGRCRRGVGLHRERTAVAGDTDICPLSTMQDLHRMVAESDKVLTF